MKAPSDYAKIPSSQVAIRQWNPTDRRVLMGQTEFESGSVVWFADRESQEYEKMKLIEAMEVQIIPEDAESAKQAEFDWTILGYDSNFIWVQLEIQNPEDVSTNGQFDTISVTFWGTEYFKSATDHEVRYGTTISHPIFR